MVAAPRPRTAASRRGPSPPRGRIAALWLTSLAFTVAVTVWLAPGRRPATARHDVTELRDATIEQLVARVDDLTLASLHTPRPVELAGLLQRLADHALETPPREARRWVPILLPALAACGMRARLRRLVRRLAMDALPEPRLQAARPAGGRAGTASIEARPTLRRQLVRLQRRTQEEAPSERPDPRVRTRIAHAAERLFLPPTPGRARTVEAGTYVNRGPLVLTLLTR